MRLALFALTAVAAAALSFNAHAQTYLNDPFSLNIVDQPVPETSTNTALELITDTHYRTNQTLLERNGTHYSVALGSLRLVGNGSSYYPSDNLKVRNDSLHVAWSMSSNTDFIVGAWRYKERQEGLPGMRDVSYGFGFTRTF